MNDTKAFVEAIQTVAPEYFESFIVGGLAGGLFGTANTVMSVKAYNEVRDNAGEFFVKNGYSKESVMRYLIDNGVSDDQTLARVSNGIVALGNGDKINSDTEAEIKENPLLRGVLYSYVEGVEIPKAVTENEENVIEPNENAAKPHENVIETARDAIENTETNLRAVSESDPEQTRKSTGRNGSKAYLTATTEGDGGLVDSLIAEGYSAQEARNKTKQFFNYLYDQGRKGTDKDTVIKAASEYILGGHEADALMYYNAGKNDADGLLIGRTNARLVTNHALRQMRKDGRINYRTERAINALASKLGIDIEFNSTMSDGNLGSFNNRTGRLMINSNAKNKFFVTAVHESVHAMRAIDPESYNKLVDIVDSVLSKNDIVYDKAWNSVLASYKKQATKDGKIDRDYIDEELTAKVVSHVLADEKFIKELAKSDRGTVQRIYDAIVDLFQKIFKRYSENTIASDKDVQAAINELKGEFNTIKTMYENALKSTKGLQQSKMKLPKNGEVMNSKNSDKSLTSNSENGNIDTSKGEVSNGEKNNIDSRGTGGISENIGNKGRRNTGDKRKSSFAETEIQNQKLGSSKSQRRNGEQKSSRESLVQDIHNSEPASGGERQEAKGRRFLEAVESGDAVTATVLLNEQAERNEYKPSKVYHGTKAETAFTKFKGEKPVWVTTDIEYASSYIDETTKAESPLYTEPDSKVYELYAKHGKVLDLGNIEQEIATYDDVVKFAKQIGFSVSEVLECRAQGRMYEDDAIWAITHTPKFAELARQKGYDSLRALEDDGKVETYGILYPQNVKSSKAVTYDSNGDIIPLTERFNSENEDIRYNLENGEEVVIETPVKRHRRESLEERIAPSLQLREEILVKLDEHIKKYGAMEKGANAVRDVTIPKKTSDKNRNVIRFTRTAIESDTISDDEAVKLMEDIANGEMWTTYKIAGDKKTTDVAYKTLETQVFDSMLSEWDALLESGKKITKQDIVNAQILTQEASKKGDAKTTCRLIAEIAAELTEAGQLVQAASMMKKLGAAANVYNIERTIDRVQREIIRRYKKKAPTLKKPTELIEKYSEALEREKKNGNKDHTESDKYAQMIYQNISEQLPSDWRDKVNAWRYFAMLGNPRTHLRNMAGNTAFAPAFMLKNIVATTGETLFIHDVEKRTKSFSGLFSVGNEYKFAKKDADEIEMQLRGNSKYGAAGQIMDNRKIYDTKWLEKVTKFNSNTLEKEDWVFLKRHYARALTMYMKAQKLNPDSMSEKQLELARLYAVKEAQKATFRDASSFASYLSAADKFSTAVEVGVSAVMPFKKTPINSLKRGIEYSPVGIIKTLGGAFLQMREGKFSANELIDDLAANLTGTGLLILGIWLASLERLRGPGDDDENKSKLQSILGMQTYSLKVWGGTYTVDWLAPAAMPMFVGCEMYNAFKDGDMSFADIMNALPRITEPIFEMSMLESLSNLVERAAYEETSSAKLGAIVAEIPSSYLGQFVPTLLGQLARTIDPTRRKIYIDKESNVPDWIQSFVQQQMKKIPAVSMMLEPYVDERGEEGKNAEGNIVVRALQNFLSPGYYKKMRSTVVDDEISRLYDKLGEGANDIIPKTVQKKIGNVNLSAEEYTEYQRTTGQTYYKKLGEIIGSAYYQKLTDEQKVDLLEKAKEYSVEKGKDSALESYRFTNGWLKTAFEFDGGFQYILDLDKKESFGVKDLQGESFDQYESDRDTMFTNILKSYKPSDADYEFADKYYDSLNEFTNRVALEKNSGGKYTIDTAWINNIKNMTAREQAEYIYGKTLISRYEKQDDAIQKDSFISDKVRMWLLQKSTGGNSSPGTMYNKYLAKYNVDQTTWGKIWEKKEEYNDRAEKEKKFDSKKAILADINRLSVSNEQKSAMYRALGYKETANALKGVPWRYVAEK